MIVAAFVKRHRKLIATLALALLAALIGVLWPHGRSPTERALVGNWAYSQKVGGQFTGLMVLGADGRCNFLIVDSATGSLVRTRENPGRWWVHRNRLVWDFSANVLESWGSQRTGPMTWIAQPLGHDIQSLNNDRLVMGPP
jgi:hypothetical protein